MCMKIHRAFADHAAESQMSKIGDIPLDDFIQTNVTLARRIFRLQVELAAAGKRG